MFNAAMHAEMMHSASAYGYDAPETRFNWNQLKTKRDAYVKKLNGIYGNNLDC